MGAQCVRMSSKLPHTSNYGRITQSTRSKIDQLLQFELIISDLQLQCATKNINKVVFSIDGCAKLQFTGDQFLHQDHIIRYKNKKRIQFTLPHKTLQSLQFKLTIYDSKQQKIQQLIFKMYTICQGPKYHDYFLKQLKMRIIYHLQINQLINLYLTCHDFKIYDHNKCDISHDYTLVFDMIIPGNQSSQFHQKKIIFSRNPEELQKYHRHNISSKKLKQSLFKIMIYRQNTSLTYYQTQIPIYQFCLPYIKFWYKNQHQIKIQKQGQKIYEKTNFKYNQKIIQNNTHHYSLQIYLDLYLKISKIYLQQIQCLIFSQNGLKTVSQSSSIYQNYVTNNNNTLKLSDLQIYQQIFIKSTKLPSLSKTQLQISIKQCYTTLFQQDKKKICQLPQIQKIQLSMLNILNILTQFIIFGQDTINQNIWMLIDKIIHRPQLSTHYLLLVENITLKTQIGYKFYTFLYTMLSKIIRCTTMGLTYIELKSIQKFIGYVYFRCQWVQGLVVNALKQQNDPQFTPQKLMEIGAHFSNKSPSKSLLYDWQQCLLPLLKNDIRYNQLYKNLLQTSQQIQNWSQLLFNRNDDDLYYGLIIEIWTQGQIFLNNQGTILWQYFPKYDLLLSTFFGQMNRNKISDYSTLFRQCSIKLLSNQKLLNNFVMLLFPKTCLYQTFCVIKCIQLIYSYFQVIEIKNKKIPNQFNYNYFYIGITSIFQSNHSYLLTKIIGLIYNYYHILSTDFKKCFDLFILNKIFYQIFLHWSGYVRKMFYLLIQYRIAVQLNRQYQNNRVITYTKNTLSLDGSQRLHQYKNMIQNIQKIQKQLSSPRKQPNNKDILYLRMKQKLNQKTHQKKQSVQTILDKKNNRRLQLYNWHAQTRKNTQLLTYQNQLPKPTRRWSSVFQADQEQIITDIPDDLKKYIRIALKQYREVKQIDHPDVEVKKILAIFSKEKSVDN